MRIEVLAWKDGVEGRFLSICIGCMDNCWGGCGMFTGDGKKGEGFNATSFILTTIILHGLSKSEPEARRTK